MAFHVPEASRDTAHPILGSSSADGNNGAFHLPSCEPGWTLALVCSDGAGWEHVSVHAYRRERESKTTTRIPTWKEMCFVKDLCWDPEDRVVQYHPPHAEYVNQHPHTLHLWRPIGVVFPAPDPSLVGDR